MPCQCYTGGPRSKLKETPPHVEISVATKSPVGDTSVVALIDHRQNAVKVYKSLTIIDNVDLEVKDMLSLLRPARMDYLLR